MRCKICNLGLGGQTDKLYKAGNDSKAIAKELRAKGYKITTGSVRVHIEHNNFGAEIIKKEAAVAVEKKNVSISDKIQEYLNMEVDTSQLSPYQKAILQKEWAKIGLQGVELESKLQAYRDALHAAAAQAGKDED